MKGFVTALLTLCFVLMPMSSVTLGQQDAAGTAGGRAAEHDFGLAAVSTPAPHAAAPQQPAQTPVQAKPQMAKKPTVTSNQKAQQAAASRAAALKKARAIAAAKKAAAVRAQQMAKRVPAAQNTAPKPVVVQKPVVPVQQKPVPAAQNKPVSATPPTAANPSGPIAAPVAASNSNTHLTTSPVATARPTAQASQSPSANREDKVKMLFSEESKQKPKARNTSDWAKTGFSTILKLTLVLVLAYMTIRALKWLSDKRETAPHGSRELQLMDTLKLSPGSSLHLVSVHGKTLLIGNTASQINLITEVEPQEKAADTQTDKRFAEYLEKYSAGSQQSGPATRIAGMLRDASAHLRGRQSKLVSSGHIGRGNGDES